MLDAALLYVISLPIYLLFLLVHLKRRVKLTTIIIHSLFYFYIIAVIGVTLFPLPIQKELIEIEIRDQFLHNNFIPFKDIVSIITQDDWPNILLQIGGNILLATPLGFLVPLIWKKRNSFYKVLVVGFWFSFGIESSQFFISTILGYTYRITDVDDIILNTIGCIMGYGCLKICLFLTKKIAPDFVQKLLN